VRNFYKVLGVATKADDQRIKTAFRHRAKSVHPDLNPGNRRAEARFIELMQAYEVLSDTKARAAYDAYLADQRSQARRRFAHCAGLMMTSFVMTAASAIFVMSLAGANVPFRESWQLAIAALSPANATASAGQTEDGGWTTQVAVAPDNSAPAPGLGEPERNATMAPKAQPRASGSDTRTDARHVASRAPATRSSQAAPDSAGASAKGSRQQVATAPRPSPAPVKRPDPPLPTTPEESWPPPAPPADEPRYSLGASDLR
jgi:curved DNA-binding protein CbpA